MIVLQYYYLTTTITRIYILSGKLLAIAAATINSRVKTYYMRYTVIYNIILVRGKLRVYLRYGNRSNGH